MTEQHKDDAMLEQYLKGESKLSAEYDAQDKHQPSEELDHLILSAAQDAVSKQAKKSKGGKNPWLIPTSIAATLVLSFSLIQLQKKDALYQQTKELDVAVATFEEKAPPENKIKAKKKERRKTENIASPAPALEEELADRERVAAIAPRSEPDTMAATGMAIEAAPAKLKRQAAKSALSKDDARIMLGRSEWLDKIKALIKNKKIVEANKEYENFVKAYPDFVPDADLKQQLGLKP